MTEVFHVELDIPTGQRDSHEAYVIVAALEEFAHRHRHDAEGSDNAEFLNALADTADELRDRISSQLITTTVRWI